MSPEKVTYVPLAPSHSIFDVVLTGSLQCSNIYSVVKYFLEATFKFQFQFTCLSNLFFFLYKIKNFFFKERENKIQSCNFLFFHGLNSKQI